MQTGIIAAILMTVFFSCMAPVWKELRNKGVSPKAILAVSGMTFPAWIVLTIYSLKFFTVKLSLLYLFVACTWVVLVVFRHSIALYLFRYKALTEMGAYGLAFSLITSLVLDFLLFRVVFSIPSLFAFSLFISAGLLISHNRIKFHKSKIGIKKTIFLLIIISILNSIFFSIYKIGLQIQENVIVHIAINQLLLSATILIYGYRDLKKNLENKKITSKKIMLVNTFLILGIFAEGYALNDLPVSIVILAALIPIIMFTVFDLRKKEVTITPQTVGAGILIIIGALLLAL